MGIDIEIGLNNLINVCAGVKKNDSVLIIADYDTSSLAELVLSNIMQITDNAKLEIISPLNQHGSEPPQKIADRMLESSVIFGLTRMSMAHSNARKNATLNHARYLSLPDYSLDVLSRPAMRADFKAITAKAEWLKRIFTIGNSLVIKSNLGTNIRCNISGRNANAAPGWCGNGFEMASPPDAEVNIAPIENHSNGIIIVDGSIPYPNFGLIKAPLSIDVENGKIKSVNGYNAKAYMNIYDNIALPGMKTLAEIGVGLNPYAKLCGAMLEDEGCLGTLHFGFGSNITIGGLNDVGFHLDHIMKNPTIIVDGQTIIDKGKIAYFDDITSDIPVTY